MQRLEVDGLVESRPRVQPARTFAQYATTQDRDEIRALEDEIDELYASVRTGQGNFGRSHVRNPLGSNHMRIAEGGRCEELCQALEKNQVLALNWLYDTALGKTAPPPAWHSQLAVALVSGDPEAADGTRVIEWRIY